MQYVVPIFQHHLCQLILYKHDAFHCVMNDI